MIRLIQRLLKYTSIKHIAYQLLIDPLETEKFRILCSIEGQTCQYIFRVINENTNTSSHSSKSYFTDSLSSL
ncbi:unnamed protein product [Rotaria sordida]|uniref:Uncharacterized protein n=1 Tax=Rotaria sordida TaxID=392033 RepID=A0A815VT83_9BILA|nr:unnamed protein product [Rotaria sordida]CAF1532206.1 unnamed protein product [Rotaria sordida]